MRIGFVAYDGPDYFAGPIVNVRRLLPELQRRGHDPLGLIIYRHNDAPAAKALADQGIECRFLPWQPYTESMVVWILEQLAELEPDVFVPNLSVQGCYAARWVREVGIPTVAVLRNDDSFHEGLVSEFVTGKREWALSGLVCVSEQLRRRIELQNPCHTTLCTIPSGVPVPRSVNAQEGPLRLAYVGRLVQKQKRVLDLVEALARVLEDIPDTMATLFGSGPERQHLENYVKARGLSHRLRLAGVVPNEQIQEELVKHHVLVLLSDYEGTPGAVMDGMACGLVPVCLDIPGGVQELVIHEQTGLLVSDRGEHFVAAIHRLGQDADLRLRLSANARQHIVNGFSLQQAAARWEDFCAQLVAEASPRQEIVIPQNLELPPVHPDLAREDQRIPPPVQRGARYMRRLAGQAKRRLLGGHT